MTRASQAPWQHGMVRRRILVAIVAATSMTAVAGTRHAVHYVVIEGMQFTPETLVVNAGDTVTWTNKDPYPHTATSESRPGFDSGEIRPGRRWSFVARKPGIFAYECVLHRTMRGRLVVK